MAIGDWQYQDRWATAFDEMRVLAEMGDEGWELTSVGPFVLHFRRPEAPERRVPWDHVRLAELGRARQRPILERDGWRAVDRWGPFHYFARSRPAD